ncbi:MAG: LuxR C-terminal-related transcriptional regulator [Pyrinomonadaceae bacterium]
MREEELRKLVEGTSDAAFVVDSEGLLVAWNEGAGKLFGVTAEQAIGQPCRAIVQGFDECGAVCSPNCTVRQAVAKRHPLESFDLQVQTVDGEQWCDVSIVIAESNSSTDAYAIHIVRPSDLRKRLEIVVRDFLVSNTGLPADQAVAMISSRTPARESELSVREIEILRFLAKGSTTRSIADQLHISTTTVNNHVQRILRKLDSHTRLEAIRRAEHAGLI